MVNVAILGTPEVPVQQALALDVIFIIISGYLIMQNHTQNFLIF